MTKSPLHRDPSRHLAQLTSCFPIPRSERGFGSGGWLSSYDALPPSSRASHGAPPPPSGPLSTSPASRAFFADSGASRPTSDYEWAMSGPDSAHRAADPRRQRLVRSVGLSLITLLLGGTALVGLATRSRSGDASTRGGAVHDLAAAHVSSAIQLGAPAREAAVDPGAGGRLPVPVAYAYPPVPPVEP